MMKKIVLLMVAWGLTQTVSADVVKNEDLILSGVSDGTAPAYDCSAGAILPINMSPTPDNSGYFDTSGLATLAVGEIVISVTPKGPVVNDPVTSEPSQEYDCESPVANMCVGLDCSNGESFGQDTLKLKENNLRVRLVNTAFGNSFGQSWNLEANSSRNGGAPYFSFQTKSLDKNYTRLVQALDGEVPEYDCSVPGTINQPPPPIGILNIGDDYIVPTLADAATDCDLGTPYPYVCTWTCGPSIDYQVENALVLGVTDSGALLNGAVSVGSGSEIESGTVTVGKEALLRRVVNLADAINDSDLINLNKLNNYSVVAEETELLADLRQQVVDMHREIDSINAEIDLIIEVDDDGDGYLDQDEKTCGSDSLDPTSIPVDTDSDGLCDNGVDDDDDGDGYSDQDEMTCGSDPLDLADLPVDTDSDGLCDNGVDDDDDGDGVNDSDDPFPLDPTENKDTDGDGIGNEADPDDDGDGYSDEDEATCGSDPLDLADLPVDTDSDGLCDNGVDDDDDGDGVNDSDDPFPLDPTENKDTDGDGIGNEADPDDDGDGYSDQDEMTCGSDPLDLADLPVDTDSDGLCDNGVDDDDDGDGVNDSDDPFPLDPTENRDTDGDGIGNETDPDDDGDGINDSEEGTYDADGDGLSNDVDTDSDNDGLSDKNECPNGSPCPDSDGDGTPDFLDAVDNSGGGSWNWWGLLLLMFFAVARKLRY